MLRNPAHGALAKLLVMVVLALTVAVSGATAEKKTSPKDPAATPKKSSTAEPASQGSAAEQKSMQDMQEMMKYAQPGPNHETFKELAGTWKATVKMFMGGPQPTVSEGTSTMQVIMGGRYLEQRFTGTMMNQPFEGYGLTGYDNQKGEYQSIWVDNSSTAMMFSQGTMDKTTNALTMNSTMTGPDGKSTPIRTVMKLTDPNTCVFTMYGPMNGQDQMLMEITYRKS